MTDNLRKAALRVTRLQQIYDAKDLETTKVDFMQEHGARWLERRNEIMGRIIAMRTEAIWALARAIA